MRAPTFIAVALVAGGVVIGCGGDDEGGSGSKQEQSGGLAQAAQRLETYLKQNTKDLSGDQAPRGQVVHSVEPSEGKLRIVTRLNTVVTTDDDPAREVCRAAKNSGVPEAKGASVVDFSHSELVRC